MKKILSLFIILISATLSFAQSPQSFRYQAIARNATGEVYANTSISFQISILENSATGTNVYTEVHTKTTNKFGLVSLSIGDGIVTSGNFSTIAWHSKSHFLKVEMDPAGGTSFQLMGTTQLISVPYALHAKTADSITGNVTVTETDPVFNASVAKAITAADTTNWNNKLSSEVDGSITNEIQALSISNDTIFLANGGFVKLPAGFDGQYSSLTGAPTNVSTFTNDAGYLTTEVDGSVTNEIQALSISNDTIFLANGGFAKLPAGFDGQYSSLTGAPTNVSTFTNDAGYLTTEVDGSVTNEIQALSISNDTIYLTNGGFVKLPAGFNGQYSSLTGAPTNVSAFTNDAGYLTTEVDGSVTNEIQALSISNDTIYLSNGGFVKIPAEVDGSVTNEIQDLKLSGDTLTITNNASPTNILLSSYSNLWTLNSGNIYRPTGNVGIGTNPTASRFIMRDTLTSSAKSAQILTIGGSTANTTNNAIFVELRGTNGTQRAGEFHSLGTNAQFNHGLYSLAQNGNQNIGMFANAGVGQASTNSGLNYGVYSIAEKSSTFNVGTVSKSGAEGTNNFGSYSFIDANSGNKNYGAAGYAYGVGSGKNYGIEAYAAGSSDTNFAVYASTGTTGTNFAGYFLGNVTITGNLNVTGSIAKGSGTFKIDHPLDPENKYLVHSFVESPDMMNVYNGNIQTDANGFATVTLPDYFEAANKDFRYQLTVMGQFAQAIVKEKISGNKFIIQTNVPNVEVSWQITGIRKDPYSNKNRIQPVQEKAAGNKGKYLHPEAYGVSKTQSINGAKKPQKIPAVGIKRQ